MVYLAQRAGVGRVSRETCDGRFRATDSAAAQTPERMAAMSARASEIASPLAWGTVFESLTADYHRSWLRHRFIIVRARQVVWRGER